MRRLFGGSVAGCLALSLWMLPHAAYAQAVIGYYDLESGTTPSAVPWQQITHLNVAFAGIDSTGQCNWVYDIYNVNFDAVYSATDVATVDAGIAALKAARNANNPNVKIMLSVGGAGLSYRFSNAVSTNSGLWTLAWSCVNLMSQLGLDGLDYDWEYPGRYGQPPCPINQSCDSSADAANFVGLLSATRYFMGYIAPLSVAVANQQTTASQVVPYEYSQMDPYLTFWNVMVYELAGSWSNGTQLQAPYSLTNAAMQYFLAQTGVTKSKVILGVPFYSKYWSGITADNGLGTQGGTCNNQGVPYSIVGPRCAGQVAGWNCSVTTVSDGAYCYCPNQQIWYTYDGPAQMTAKSQLAASMGLGGMMFWQLPGDSSDFELTAAIVAGQKTPTPVQNANTLAAAIIAIIL